MSNEEASATLVKLYADLAVLSDKYGGEPPEGGAEAVAMAVHALMREAKRDG